MGGLGSADGQPGYHSPNIGHSVISKRTLTAAKTANRCPRLFVLLFRTTNYLVRARIWPVYGGRNGPRSAFSADLRATPQTHRRLFGKSRKENSANFVFTEFLRS